MAMYDWNHDGKKDWQDNFIEYQIYKNTTGKKDKSSYTPGSGNGMSTLGAIVSVVGGFVLQALLYMVLEIDVDDVPGFVILIFWVLFSVMIAVIVDKIGL